MRPPGADPDHLCVLLVEDDAAFAFLIRRRLEAGGRVQVTVVRSMSEASQRLTKLDVDCVLLDLALPDSRDMAGVERLRLHHPDVPVVVLTGNDDERLALLAIAAGAQDYLAKAAASAAVLDRAVRYAIERKRHENELARLALHDQLTGLPNRRLFFDRLEQALARTERTGDQVGVIYIDVDHFKNVNDTHGHRAGDDLLRHVAHCLEGVVRPGDTLARLAGDEFAMLVDRAPDEPQLRRLGARLVQTARTPMTTGGRVLTTTLSVGIAVASSGLAADDLLQRADAALYLAKRRGRDQYAFGPGEHDGDDAIAAELAGQLADADTAPPFELHAQRIVSLADDEPIGSELLLRWQHPRRGLVLPGAFVAAAERAGLIVEIGRWVLDRACELLEEVEVGTLAINVSGEQLDDPHLLQAAREAARRGADLSRLCVEISESALHVDPARAHRLLSGLRDLGALVAIDHFGAGTTSLRYLQDIPADILKLDRSLVARIHSDDRARLIVAALVEMARALDLRTVAEGVETAEQRDALVALGCDAAQGFLWGRPQPLTPRSSGAAGHAGLSRRGTG